MRKRKALSALTLAALLGLLLSPVVLAVEAPQSKQMVSCEAYNDLSEDGDVTIVFHWNWDYSINGTAEYSDTVASDSIIYRFYDTDGTTLLATDAPYVYSPFGTNGYGNNIGSFYFSFTDNLTWGEAYIINIYGVPAEFSPAVNHVYTMADSDWNEMDTQAASRSSFYAHIMVLADRFDALYDVELTSSSDSGIVLSTYGELLFRGVITGIQMLCPSLFFIQVYIPDQMAVTSYDLAQQASATERLDDTDMGESLEAGANLMGTTKAFYSAGLFLIVIVAIMWQCIKRDWGIEAGLGMSVPVGILGAVLVGEVLFTILMCASLLAGMGLLYLLQLKRA